MKLGLCEKSVLVLASGSGIGRGCALEFAREGANVMLFGPHREKLEKVKAEIDAEVKVEKKGQIGFVEGDITIAEDIDRVVTQTVAEFGGLYALVNNTGGPPAGPFVKFDDMAWQSAFELTLLSYVRATRAVLPVMKKGGGGRIVNIASSSTKRVIENLILSNVFRMGVLGLTKSLSRETGGDNILVNTVSPGKIRTDRVDYLDGLKAAKAGITLAAFQEQNAKTVAMGRYGSLSEIGRLVVFLCSEANSYVTGQNLLIDGGWVEAY